MSTPQLYDPDEENWQCKLHLGCGQVHLMGYLNIDVQGIHPNDVEPRVLGANRTTIGEYYTYSASIDKGMPAKRQVIADLKIELGEHSLPFEPSSIDKIAAIQFLEHLNIPQLERVLTEIWYLLKPGGILVATVPEVIGTTHLVGDAEQTFSDFGARHMLGSAKDSYSLHRSWFRLQDFLDLLEWIGFEAESIDNPHFYPAIAVRARRRVLKVISREYQVYPGIEKAKSVLDVGPGKFINPYATHWWDKIPRTGRELSRDVEGTVSPDITELPFESKHFDYAVVSHVLEHVEDPIKALAECMRVATAGFVEVPSMVIDWMFQFGTIHRWLCSGSDQFVVFTEYTPADLACYNKSNEGVWLFATARYDDHDFHPKQRAWRSWWWQSQPTLHINAWWDEKRHPTIVVRRLDGSVEIYNGQNREVSVLPQRKRRRKVARGERNVPAADKL